MVEHECDLRHALHQFGDGTELMMFDAEVKGKPKLRQSCHTRHESSLKAKVRIALALEISADTFDQGTLSERLKLRLDGIAFLQIGVGNDRFQSRLSFCQIRNPIYLRQIL